MQISKKSDYAIRAVAILASLAPGKTMQAQELAQSGQIPIKFLEQILLVLKRAGLLKSKRGVGGGYRLGRESRAISLADVIVAVDGELILLVEDDGYPVFPGASGIRQSLEKAQQSVNEILEETTIEDIVNLDAGDSMVGYGI